MGTREKLLSLLEQNRDRYLSGEEIAGLLNVSRTAVWKAVNSLRAAGWDVDAVSRRGYRLAAGTDVLSDAGIRKYLEPEWSGLTLEVLPETASTNDFLKEKAVSGAPEGYVVTARSQTAGKGRTGRSFFSPADTGVYLSLLLRPARYTPQQAVRLTTMAAVAACEAVSGLTGEQAMIKWVNDIFLHGRKVSGILTEAALSLESGFLDFAVLGVGFNVYPPRGGFPEELRSVAGSVFPSPRSDGKNSLAAAFLNRFFRCYTAPEDSAWTEEYRKRSLVVGKRILVLLPDGQREAEALDVDENCRLLVRYDDGAEECLTAGEISILPLQTE